MAELDLRTVNVGNLDHLLRTLPRKMTNKHVRRATRQGAAMVRDRIKQIAPVRDRRNLGYRKGNRRPPPGRLRRLVRSKGRRGKRTYTKASVFYPTEGAGHDRKNAFYWRFVNFGTRHMPPQPYIDVAAAQMFRPVVRHTVKEVNTGIRVEMRRAGL